MKQLGRIAPLVMLTASLTFTSTFAWADESDDLIQGRVEAGLFLSPRLSNADITVSVDQGVVVLSGTLGGSAQRDLAMGIASGIPGVDDVSDDLSLQGGGNDEQTTAGNAQRQSDAFIAWQEAHMVSELMESLENSPAMEDFDISLSLEGDTLILEGQVATDIERTVATQLAQRLEGVSVVNNQIQVAAAEDTDAMTE